jgi:hypothetical protein
MKILKKHKKIAIKDVDDSFSRLSSISLDYLIIKESESPAPAAAPAPVPAKTTAAAPAPANKQTIIN